MHEKPNSSAGVVSRLQEIILSGELRPGDRLPPERELAKLLGVSRPTLRAGIRSLVAAGVLTARQGAGTFVVDSDGPLALDSGPLRLMAWLHDFTADEMFEARRALEMCAAGLAAERATGEQMAAMSEEIAGMYASLDDPEQHLVHDVRFHQTVAAASGNRILATLMGMVTTAHSEVLRRATNRSSELKGVSGEHQEIYRAIRGRDPEAARAAMRRHLDLAQEGYEAGEEGGGGQKGATVL